MMDRPNISEFLADSNVDLEQRPTKTSSILTEKDAKKQLKQIRKDLADFQNRLYAHDRYSVLICIQGMDTAGKDSLIREVFKQCNVRGVQHHSFKSPTDLEHSHGYLWRHYIALPAKGKFGIFNRTHYENVLVTRVHPEYLMAENLPNIHSVEDITEDFWQMRFRQIRDFEREIAENGTIIFKFFLHLSKQEQKNRLLRRLNKPEKNWKFSAGDLDERELWDHYQHCYEQAIRNTHTDHAPWYIIPADSKPHARMTVASILEERLSGFTEVQNPELDPKTSSRINEFKHRLQTE